MDDSDLKKDDTLVSESAGSSEAGRGTVAEGSWCPPTDEASASPSNDPGAMELTESALKQVGLLRISFTIACKRV